MRLGGWKHETYDATLLKNEDREYELAKAPVKRLLKKEVTQNLQLYLITK